MNKGKLINVELSRGRYVKMYEADAIAQGLIKSPAAATRSAAAKARIPPANKIRKPPANKVNGDRVASGTDQRMVATGLHEPKGAMAKIAELSKNADQVTIAFYRAAIARSEGEVEQLATGSPEPKTDDDGDGNLVADDLTTIPGVGKASARALAAHGVTTLDALKEAQDLDYLPAKVLAAIAEWRLVACDQTERG